MKLPAWLTRIVRALAPAEFREDLLDDLHEGYARRASSGDGARWLLRELVRTPWLRLRIQARRMRTSGARRGAPKRAVDRFGSPWPTLAVATRSLLKRPQYTVVAVLTIAASIGSATLIFSVLEGVLLRPLPYEGGERVYRIFATNAAWREAEQEVLRDSWDRLDITRDMLEALRGRVPGAEAIGAYTDATLRLDDALNDPVQLPGAHVLPGFFETLPLAPILGRTPGDDELASGAAVVVLGERLWTSRYGRDPDIVGQQVSLAGALHEVIGVLPAEFAVPDELARWWTPLPPGFAGGRSDVAVFGGLVRLAPGSDAEAASEALAGVGERLAEGSPAYAGMGVRLRPLAELLVAEVREGLLLLFLAVGAVVLIGSVNLANLMIAGSARRRGELAMRSALGASRWQLVWAQLSETTVICAAGGVMGVALAGQLLDPFLALLSRSTDAFPRVGGVRVNGLVLAFSAGVTTLTALLAGLPPALSASRLSPWEALQQGRRSRGGRAARRTQRSLLLVEATLATTLLAFAGLLTRSALNLSAVDPGFASRSVAYLAVETPEDRFPAEADVQALGAALEARLRSLPGVSAVARASALPGVGSADGKLVWRPQATVEAAELAWSSAISPGYFAAMGIGVLAGRAFGTVDGPDDPPVAVVSERFAERFFPGEQAVGQTLLMSTDTRLEGGKVVAAAQRSLTVVGVASDVRQLAVMMEPDPVVYLPIAQTPGRDPKLILRTTVPPEDVVSVARAEVRALDASLLVTEANVLRASMQRLTAPLGVRTALLVVLAGLAAFLTAVGIYGVVAYVVSDQLHEIGVRMALGARSGGEVRRAVRQAMKPVLAGCMLGLVGAWASGALVESALFGVGTLDVPTYLGVAGMVAVVAAVAAWMPARRAAAVDPTAVLSKD